MHLTGMYGHLAPKLVWAAASCDRAYGGIVVELGRDADAFMLHLYAALAEKERRLISERTTAALQVKRLKRRKPA